MPLDARSDAWAALALKGLPQRDLVTLLRALGDPDSVMRASRSTLKALLPAAMQALGLTLTGPEVEPTVLIDITAQKALKVRALRTYTTQEDAQRLADLIAQAPWALEAFHQAYPPVSAGVLATGFWEVSDSAG